MAGTPQDVVLNFVTKLDNSQLESQLGQSVASISSAIQKAFDQIAENMAQAILKGTAQSLANVQQLTSGGLPSVQNAQSQFQTFSGAGPASPILQPIAPGQTTQLPALNNYTGQMRGGYPAFETGLGENTNDMVTRAKLINDMRSRGLSVPLGQEDQQNFRGLRSSLQEGLQGAPEEQLRLLKEIQDLGKTIAELNNTEKEAIKAGNQVKADAAAGYREGFHRDQASAQEKLANIQNQANANQVLDQVLKPQMPKGLQTGLNVAGGIGAILAAAADVPGLLRSSEVSGIETNNLTSRSLMRGDIDRTIAIDRAGGQGALKSQGNIEAGMQVGGALGGALASLAMAPMTGGLSLMGLLPSAISGVKGIAGFNSNRQASVEGQIGAEMGREAEYFSATSMGRDATVGGFRAGQGMGAPELSGLLAGGGNSRFVRDAMSRDQSDAASARSELASLESMGTAAGGSGLDQRRQALMARISKGDAGAGRLAGDLGAAEGTMVGGRSLREIAAGANLDEAGLRGGIGRLSAGMGGVFGGQAELNGLAPQIGTMLRMQGVGIGQAPEIASGMFQAGMGRGEAMNSTREMMEDAIAAGLDKARMGQAMLQVASRANSMGVGGAGVAMADYQQSMSMASQIFGGRVEGSQANMVSGMMNSMADATRSGSGLGGIAGIRTADQFMKNAGVNLSAPEQVQFANSAQDPEGLAMMLKRKATSASTPEERDRLNGIANDPERLKAMTKEIEASRRFQLARTALEGSNGNEDVAMLNLGQEAKTTQQQEVFREVFKNIRNGGQAPKITGMPEVDIEETLKQGQTITKDMGRRMREERGESTPLDIEEQRASAAPGAAMAKSMAEVDMNQVARGLSEMGDILPTLNRALGELKDRTDSLFGGSNKASNSPPAPNDVSQKQFDKIIQDALGGSKGNSSSMAKRAGPFSGN